MLRHQRDEFSIGATIHRRAFQLRPPDSIRAGFFQQTNLRAGFRFDLNDRAHGSGGGSSPGGMRSTAEARSFLQTGQRQSVRFPLLAAL
jgi:hypothetical protein